MKKNRVLELYLIVFIAVILFLPSFVFANSPGMLMNEIVLSISNVSSVKSVEIHVIYDDGTDDLDFTQTDFNGVYDTTKNPNEGYIDNKIYKPNSNSFYLIVVLNNNDVLKSNTMSIVNQHQFNYNPDNNSLTAISSIKNKWDFLARIGILLNLLMPLIVTVVIETLIAVKMLGKIRLRTIIWTNIFSNITMNFILVRIFAFSEPRYWLVLLIAELSVVLFEFYIYFLIYRTEIKVRKIFIYTVLANTASCVFYLGCFSLLLSLID